MKVENGELLYYKSAFSIAYKEPLFRLSLSLVVDVNL